MIWSSRVRLRYLAILLVSLLAIMVGLFPSLLTLGAILGIVVGSIALIGLVHPPTIESRRRLRRFTHGAGIVLTAEVILLALRLVSTPRRTVHLELTKNAPGLIRIVYDVTDGEESPYWRFNRYFVVNPAPLGIVYTQLPPDNGWFNARNPHPVVARTIDGLDVPARWISGGYSRAANCRVEYEEFSIGDSAPRARDPTTLLHAGWLDSLSGWGVTCQDGRLRRGTNETMTRTAPPCYFDQDGVLACGAMVGVRQ